MTDVNGWVGGLEVVVELGRAFTFAGRRLKLRPRTSAWVAMSALARGNVNWSAQPRPKHHEYHTEGADGTCDGYSEWYLIFF
jgi:hypothetical protein